MSILFSSGRNIFNTSDWSIVANPSSTTSDLTAGTYYFAIQGRNRLGLNLPIYKQITIANEDSIIITLNSTVYGSGEDWTDIILSYSTSSDPSQYFQILSFPFKQNGTEDITGTTLPVNIEIEELEDLSNSTTVADIASISDSSYFNGRLIYVQSLSSLYEFYNSETFDPGDLDGVNQFSTANGLYKKRKTVSTLITNIDDYKGSNLDVRSDLSLVNTLILPTATIDGSESPAIRFTIFNPSTSDIPSNSIINLEAYINSKESVALLEGALKVIFIGIANHSTGNLRTDYYVSGLPITSLNQDITYNVQASNLYTPDVIKQNEGLILELTVTLDPANFSALFPNGAGLFIYPSIYPSFAFYSPFYNLFPTGVISESLDNLALLPLTTGNLQVERGEVLFDGYSITRNVAEILTIPNSSIKEIILNKSGNITVENEGTALTTEEVKVCTVKKETGDSIVSMPVSVTVSTNGSFTIDIAIGLDVNSQVAIRSNYENTYLKNVAIDPFITTGYLFIKNAGGTIYKHSFTITNVVSQTVSVTSISGDPVVGSVNTLTKFGLLNSPSLSNVVPDTVGTLPAGTYTVYCGYSYTGVLITDLLNTLPLFNIDNILSGTSSNNISYNVISLASSPSITLDFEEALHYEITVAENIQIEAPSDFFPGSEIAMTFVQDNTGGFLVLFDSFFEFDQSFSGINIEPDSITIIKGIVSNNSIRCWQAGLILGSTSLLGNDQLIGNDFLLGN